VKSLHVTSEASRDSVGYNVDLSIVIVNWNAHEVTAACVDSIARNLEGLEYEIILVDNASSDGSVECFRKDSRVRLIENDSNLGFAKANNIGLRLAVGQVLLLLNNDTVILDDSIQRSLEYLQSRPTVGMMGCKLLNTDGTLQRSCSRFPRILTFLIGGQVVARIVERLRPHSEFLFSSAYLNGDHLRELRPDWIMGAFMMVKREAIEAAGMLDEDYFMYREDMDWCYRIRLAGWEIAYSPAPAIVHLGGGSSRAVPEATLRRELASVVLYFRKHHPDKVRAMILVRYASFLIEFIVRVVMLPFSGLHNREQCRNVERRLLFFKEEIRHAMQLQLSSVPRAGSSVSE